MLKNTVKQKLLEGKTVLGTFQCMDSRAASAVLADSGFDWIIVDMEHGMMDLETAGDMAETARSYGAVPFIRVSGNDDGIIKRALDAGPLGVMIPMVNTKADAQKAVSACKYSPQGVRGIGPGRASLFGLHLAEYTAQANQEIMVLLQAEHKDAVDAIDEILSVAGIDVIFVGPLDLSCSMGLIGQPNHPAVEAAVAKVLEAAQRHGVVPGIFCMDAREALRRAEQGFRFIAVGLDSKFLAASAAQALESVRSGLGPKQ